MHTQRTMAEGEKRSPKRARNTRGAPIRGESLVFTVENLLCLKTLNPFFFPLIHAKIQVYCIKLKVHSTKSAVFQNMITAVLLWNRFPPSRVVPVQFVEYMLCVDT